MSDERPARLAVGVVGAGRVGAVLGAALARAGHHVVWLCDPMHGNTVKAPSGVKVRSVRTLVAEVRAFHQAVLDSGGTPAGLHLETTPFDVAECVWGDPAEIGDGPVPVPGVTPSFCDPRLNPAQAVEVVRAWAATAAEAA